MQIIRDYLRNHGFYRHGLDPFHHAHASVAVAVLEDAELAIAHYLENAPSGAPGAGYLRTYGVLQAAYLQQDAARVLREAFGLDSTKWPKAMDKLRDLRNRAIGHPVDAPGKKRPATIIARYALSTGSLEVLQITPDGPSPSSSVDLRVMLREHSEALQRWMKELVDELQYREEERRKDISAGGLVSALMPRWWRYALQKIHEAAVAPDAIPARLAQTEVSSLLKMLAAVEAGLRERDVDPPHSRAIEIACAALDRLSELLNQAASGEAVQLDIDAFATLAERHLTDIAGFLQEIDERLKDS